MLHLDKLEDILRKLVKIRKAILWFEYLAYFY
jgi:hypothetical protein